MSIFNNNNIDVGLISLNVRGLREYKTNTGGLKRYSVGWQNMAEIAALRFFKTHYTSPSNLKLGLNRTVFN